MKRVVWLTDIHLSFLRRRQIDLFLRSVLNHNPDHVLISGDIGEASDLLDHLKILSEGLEKSVYFALGNHDFYGGSIVHVRTAVEQLTQSTPRLTWLTRAGVVELAPDTGLVGHDSWADGRYGDYHRSPVILNDYLLIDELSRINAEERFLRLNALGDEAASYFRVVLPEAFERYPHVFLVTHVPPFKESCWHEGRPSSDAHLPHFSCKAVGDALLEIMQAYPDRELTVLCGHTHSGGQVQIMDNLRVITGGAIYGAPVVQQVFDI